MSKKIPILLILIILFVSACAWISANTQEPQPLPTPTSQTTTDACDVPSSWTIQFHRTGGFGGFDESMTLDDGGNLTVNSRRPKADVEEQISGEQINAISNMLVQACPFEAGSSEGNCADCFLYTLDIQMDNHTYSVKVSDVTVTENLKPLVGTLSQILQDAE